MAERLDRPQLERALMYIMRYCGEAEVYTKQILALIPDLDANLFELASDQTLPKTNPSEDKMRSRLTIPSAILLAQQDMLKPDKNGYRWAKIKDKK